MVEGLLKDCSKEELAIEGHLVCAEQLHGQIQNCTERTWRGYPTEWKSWNCWEREKASQTKATQEEAKININWLERKWSRCTKRERKNKFHFER